MFAHFRGFRTRSWFDELNPPLIALAFETVERLRRMQDLLCTWPLKIQGKIVKSLYQPSDFVSKSGNQNYNESTGNQ